MMFYYCEKIRDILRDNISEDKLGYFIIGNPDRIPKEVAQKNFVAIYPNSIIGSSADTSKDTFDGDITLVIGTQVQNNWQENDYVLQHQKTVSDLYAGRDENGDLKTDTILYLLRARINKNWLNQPDFSADLISDVRPEDYIFAIDFNLTITDHDERGTA